MRFVIDHLLAQTAATTAAAEKGSLILDFAKNTIDQFGLAGAGFLMALESMITPLPSEVVMPPLGVLVQQGRYSWELAILATSIGSLIGSLISYYLGYFGGKPLVMKVGKWLLLNEHHLDLTSNWFSKRGSTTVFVCRFIPVVRHLISIPAGIARMNLLKFCVYTVIGATLWNSFLLWFGWQLGNNWHIIVKYRKPIDYGMVAILIGLVIAWYWIHLRKPKPVAADVTTRA